MYWFVINNLRFLKANYNYTFQTSDALNASGNYLIKVCLHWVILFSIEKEYTS